MSASRTALGGVIVALALAVAAGGFVAPYDPATQYREFGLAPPTSIHLVDAAGHWHARPFVYRLKSAEADPLAYDEDRSRGYPIRLLVSASSDGPGFRLLGVDPPARLFLLGTDALGRDRLSRLLVGTRVSIAAGLLAAGVSLGLGTALGLLAGFYGGRVDALVMRSADVFLALPWIYLLLAARSALPLTLGPSDALMLIVATIGIAGWARPARLVRGIVLSGRVREYVIAARAFGAGTIHVMMRHLLPQTSDIVATQAALLVPQFTLAEVTLSYFGLGTPEPVPSLGTLLGELTRQDLLGARWFTAMPIAVLTVLFFVCYAVANALSRNRQVPTF